MDKMLKSPNNRDFNFEGAESQLKRKPTTPGTNLNANKVHVSVLKET